MQGVEITYWSGLTLKIPYEAAGAIGFTVENGGLVILNQDGGWIRWISLKAIREFKQY